jgi:hypothetical protein
LIGGCCCNAAKEHPYSLLSSRVRNRQELNAKLKGATLGDAAEGDDDTLKWIKRSKKKEKELAKKRQEEFERIDQAIQEEYTERTCPPAQSSYSRCCSQIA